MDPKAVVQIYQAYINGEMTPEEQKYYLADIESGDMQSPKSPGFVPPVLNPGIWEAYKSGVMTTDEKVALEKDIKEGLWTAPEGATPEETQPLGLWGSIKEMFTGAERTTPEIEAMPDWSELPELDVHKWEGLKAALATAATDIPETAKIIQDQFPDIQMRQDEKGNYIFKSAIDGKEYAIKPGFRTSDALRAAFVGAAFIPAGRVASFTGKVLAAGATQAAFETSEAASGGDLDLEMIAMSAAGEGAGHLISKGFGSISSKFSKIPAATENIAKNTVSMEDITKTTRKAGGGSTKHIKELAEQVAPDKEAIEAAERLGIVEFLQPDHVSTRQSAIELFQGIKSAPSSTARELELKGFEGIAKRADDLIEEIGGTLDQSQFSHSVKTRMTKLQSELDFKSEKIWDELNSVVDPKMDAPATNLLAFLKGKADDLGGVEYLDPLEKQLMRQLSPTKKGGLPTYARVDNIRRKLTAARVRGQGEFKDADVGLIKKLEKELMIDQRAALGGMGEDILKKFDLAREMVAVRKGLEDDMKSLFGKHLDGSIIGDLSSGIKKLAAGDVSKFIQLLEVVPEDMRKEVVASGMNTAFGKTARNGNLNFNSYANWYEGLLNNKRAYNALMINLPAGARRQLKDLYKVSNGIRKASKERITTGRVKVLTDQIKGADNMMANIYEIAKRSSVGIAAGTLTTSLGFPGMGLGLAAGISSALAKGKTNYLKAADVLISSPEFMQMVLEGTPKGAKYFTKSSAWKRFYKAMGKPQDLSNPEQWILAAYQTQKEKE